MVNAGEYISEVRGRARDHLDVIHSRRRWIFDIQDQNPYHIPVDFDTHDQNPFKIPMNYDITTKI